MERSRECAVAGVEDGGRVIKPAALRALGNLAEGFYRRVYPPELEKEDELFDFSETAFLNQFIREGAELFQTKGTLPEYSSLGRAELGLYQTLHCLRARVQTSKTVRKFLRLPRS
jgi:hypothetical protein